MKILDSVSRCYLWRTADVGTRRTVDISYQDEHYLRSERSCALLLYTLPLSLLRKEPMSSGFGWQRGICAPKRRARQAYADDTTLRFALECATAEEWKLPSFSLPNVSHIQPSVLICYRVSPLFKAVMQAHIWRAMAST